MGMPAAAAKDWTVEMLETLPDDGKRYEIIEGELFVTPAPAWRHQDVLGELHFAFRSYLKLHRAGFVLTAPADVDFDRQNIVQPDLFVAPLAHGRKPASFKEAGSLLLAIEILSPSTGRLDRTKKRDLYRRFEVAEYWIVDMDARLVERWKPDDRRPEIVEGFIEWRPSAEHAPLEIDLQKFFAGIHGDELTD